MTKINRKTLEDFLPGGKSEKFGVKATSGGPKIFRNGENIREKKPTELYLNETELKQAAIDFLKEISNCMVLETASCIIICFRGFFITFITNFEEKDLDYSQKKYRENTHNSGGTFIFFHSVYNLESEMLKRGLIDTRFFKK